MDGMGKPTPTDGGAGTPIKVLVVDDSAFMRFTITRYLNEAGGIQVVGAAHDGQEALALIPVLQPDIVTLDVEMPHLDGLSTLREIMADYPRPVIMLSSTTSDGALETIQALTLGAVDFIQKPSNKANVSAVMDDVVNKIRRAAKAKVWAAPRVKRAVPEQPAAISASRISRPLQNRDRVVIIGSSTGGPRALNSVLPELSGDLPAAFVVVQHMPVGFTRSLAERLDTLCSLSVKEAQPGDKLEVGRVLVAPGGFHMVLNENGEVALNQDPAVNGVRPAIDVTMNSLTRRYGSSVIGVVLTGMGSDGTIGSGLIHSAKGYVIAEAESSCVVWGMPRSVAEAGFADEIVPLTGVASAITQAVKRSPGSKF
jgi:two-component system, chemotaxis family, protein-glutamate methylesterase/glutaminase